ncbi:MAG: ATP synthase F0 subunit B [Bryobacteraceae bacterium]
MRARLRFSICAAILFLAGAHYVFAQETQQQEVAALDAVTWWKIINTALFAIGLGYLIWKYAPAFFNARSASIQKAIQDATGLKIEAEFRYSEIDRKMATLAAEVKKLRDQAAIERERGHEHFRHETEMEVQHIQHNVAAEIEGFRKEGARQVRGRTAQLAFQLAERRLRDRFASSEPEELMQDFVNLIERGKN